MFGGLATDDLSNQTWLYDTVNYTWTRVMPASAPSPRFGHAMVYDDGMGRVVLFGGRTRGGLSNETWVYDLANNTWAQSAPLQAPTPRERHEMAYDGRSGRIVLFGGWTGADSGETWVYDTANNTWTPMNPLVAPAPRHDHSMVYEPRLGRLALFGGSVAEQLNNETWAYDLPANTWTNVAFTGSPPPRDRHAMAYLKRTGRSVLFGGQTLGGLNGETWFLDLENTTWTGQQALAMPPARRDHAIVGDARTDQVVLFGGWTENGPSSDTWILDASGTAWVDTFPSPPFMSGHGMVYESRSGLVVLFGGTTGGGLSNETWTYDFAANSWTKRVPSMSPSGRTHFAMAHDTMLNRIVVHGGDPFLTSPYVSNETWAYDVANNTWTNLTAAGSPSARGGHAMVFDERAGRFVMFGGWIGPPTFLSNETWVYDLANNTWTNMSPAVAPSPRDIHAMAYDGMMGRVILFGGRTVGAVGDETWVYDLANNTWTNMRPAVAPARRDGHKMVYDSDLGRTILFGGFRALPLGLSNETWMYDLLNNTWWNISPESTPSPRSNHALVYLTQRRVSVLFGGFTPERAVDDLWWYRSPGLPTAPQMLRATPRDSGVSLTWDPPATDGGTSAIVYGVYRGTSSGSLSLLIETGNVLMYNDTGLTNGVTYYYQVGALNPVGNGPRSSEVFATPFAAPDLVSPTVTILSPANGTVLMTGSVLVSGIANDDVGLALVEVSTDGASWVPVNGTRSWAAVVALAAGPNTIHARAIDTSNNMAMATVTVTVRLEGPPIYLLPVGLGLAAGFIAVALLLRRKRRASMEFRPDHREGLPPRRSG